MPENGTNDFRHVSLPGVVRFGAGAIASLPAELDGLGLSRILVLSTPGRAAAADAIVAAAGDRVAGVFAEAREHVPAELAQRAATRAVELGANGCLAVGGGSAVGLGKAVALRHGLPVVAVPTTFAGSEMTPVWGLTEAGHKRTGRDPRVLPRLVIYDVDLVAELPHTTAVTSALNAMAHAAEALYAPDGSPVVSLLAEEGVRSLATALDTLGRDPTDLEARELAMRGAWLSGTCLGATTMSLHHKICHVLGGMLGLGHAATHAAVLPAVLAFNLPAAPRAAELLERALDDADPARRIWELGRTSTVPPGLAGLGMRWEECATVAAEVCAAPYANPRPVGLAAVTQILETAWAGTAPTGWVASGTDGIADV